MRTVRSSPRLSFITPQLATLVDRPPSGPGWLHEAKQDGWRAQVIIDGGNIRVLSRRGLDWTSRFKQIAKAATGLKCRSAIIDGEAVVQGKDGIADYAAKTLAN